MPFNTLTDPGDYENPLARPGLGKDAESRALCMSLVKLSVGSMTLGKRFGIIFKVEDAHACPPVMLHLDKCPGKTLTLVRQESHTTHIATSGRMGMSPAVWSLAPGTRQGPQLPPQHRCVSTTGC